MTDTPAATTTITLKNSLAKISFCDRECYNVNNNKTKEIILKHITTKFKIQVIDKQYVSLNPHMLRNITSHEHIISTFTNGNPYLLWLTKIDDVPSCIYIDRKLKDGYSYPKIHVVTYQFAADLFDQDTIFTGELVRDINRNWQFLISDILYHNNTSTKPKNVLARFQLIYSILENQYTPDLSNDICPIYVKQLFQYADIKKVFTEFIPSLSYICKGLVFYTLNNQFSNYAWILPKEDQIQVKRKHEADEAFFAKYPQYIRHRHILDNQAPYLATTTVSTPVQAASVVTEETRQTEQQTVKLYIVKTDIPDIYYLYTKDDRINRQSIAFIPNLKTSHMLLEFFKANPGTIDVIANCKYQHYFKRWIPLSLELATSANYPLTVAGLQKVTDKLQKEYKGATMPEEGGAD